MTVIAETLVATSYAGYWVCAGIGSLFGLGYAACDDASKQSKASSPPQRIMNIMNSTALSPPGGEPPRDPDDDINAAKALLAALGGMKVGKEIYDAIKSLKAQEAQNQTESDKYVIYKLEAGQCENVMDPEKFSNIVLGTFRRNPVHEVFLQGQYVKCLQASKKYWRP